MPRRGCRFVVKDDNNGKCPLAGYPICEWIASYEAYLYFRMQFTTNRQPLRGIYGNGISNKRCGYMVAALKGAFIHA